MRLCEWKMSTQHSPRKKWKGELWMLWSFYEWKQCEKARATMTSLFKSFVSAVVGNYSNWWQLRKKHQNFLSLVTFFPSLRRLVLGELSFNKVFLSLLLVISTVTLTLSSSHNFFPTRVTILIGTTCRFMLRRDLKVIEKFFWGVEVSFKWSHLTSRAEVVTHRLPASFHSCPIHHKKWW